MLASITFSGRTITAVVAEDLPLNLATELHWGDGDRVLHVARADGSGPAYDFGIIPLEEADCAALSIRISPAGGFQADCLLGKGRIPRPAEFSAGAVAGLRLQPVLLVESSQQPPPPLGQGLFARGLHYPGVVTRSNVSLLCLCDGCGRSFRLQSFHSGFLHSEYYYCGSGLHTLLLDAASLSQLSDDRLTMESSQSEIEKLLPQCKACSEPFRYLNPLRCPHCHAAYIDFATFPDIRKSEYYGNLMFGAEAQRPPTHEEVPSARRVIARPAWGTVIVEDEGTHKLSLQCLSGGFAMYWHRVVLTPDEAAAFRAGQLDVDTMVREMNHGTERMAKRIVPAYAIDE
jgi:hypothetical protein